MDQQLAAELAEARREIELLRRRLDAVEGMQSEPDLPDTMLLDPGFVRRAFAVWGHNFVASLIIVMPIYILMVIVIILVAGWS